MLDYGRTILPAMVNPTTFPISYDELHSGIVLTGQDRLGASNIGVNAVTTNASPDGHPHLRVMTGPLVVRAYDMAAVQCLADTWQTAQTTAEAIWRVPVTDGPAYRDQLERNEMARTGKPPAGHWGKK